MITQSVMELALIKAIRDFREREWQARNSPELCEAFAEKRREFEARLNAYLTEQRETNILLN